MQSFSFLSAKYVVVVYNARYMENPMSDTSTTAKYPWVRKIKEALSSLSGYYFVPIALLAVVAFFSPPVAGLGVVILLTGAVWVLVDSCGGISHSIDFLLNTRYHHEEGKDYVGKKIHLLNLLWCAVMVVVTAITLTTATGALWASLASIAFGCAMWIYVLDDLHAKQWDLNALRNPRSLSRLLGGLGALLLAFYVGGLAAYPIGVIGMLCYILAAIVKVVDIFYNDSLWPSESIRTDTPPSPGQAFEPIDTHDPDISPSVEVAPQEAVLRDVTLPIPSDLYQLGKLPEFVGAFAQIINMSMHYQDSAAPITQHGASLLCSPDESGVLHDHFVVAMMARAASAYQLQPIYISGGSEQAQIVAIQAALRFGFADIEVRPPTAGTKPHPEYDAVVRLVHAIGEHYDGHKALLETVKTGHAQDISRHILEGQYHSLPPMHQCTLAKLYPEVLGDLALDSTLYNRV
jgi:hypothetical protein